ncbi:MAG: hypothetical protein ARM1_0247 [Candidatus Micrarchaeota archaeon]|nr:MAG: hypothetical protein ARM1_0247 [Candidatus Micrarchaeota archaeon]
MSEEAVELNINILNDESLNNNREITIVLQARNNTEKLYWCQVAVKTFGGVTLLPSDDVSKVEVRLGILKPNTTKEKQLKIFLKKDYNITEGSMPILNATALFYDEDGVIDARVERGIAISSADQHLEAR